MQNNNIPPLSAEDWKRFERMVKETYKDSELLMRIYEYLVEVAQHE